MASESATHRGQREKNSPGKHGELVLFPPRRSFGPFSWRIVRIASLAVLLLIVSGALLELFLGRALRAPKPATPHASGIRS